MADVDIKVEEGKFKLRVSAILIHNGKMLVHEGKKFVGFCFPGGHVQIGESTSEAILREIKEETNLSAKLEHLVCVDENLYTTPKNTISHEINYYYYLTLRDKNMPLLDFENTETEGGISKTQKFHWISVDELMNANLQPSHILRTLSG